MKPQWKDDGSEYTNYTVGILNIAYIHKFKYRETEPFVASLLYRTHNDVVSFTTLDAAKEWIETETREFFATITWK